MYKKLLFVFFFFSLISFAQDSDRVRVKGKIIVDVKDVAGVTVFNTSSNKGTITDENGVFYLNVALNDNIEVSAIQFVPFTFKIDKESLITKQLFVYLVERVNNLDEVVLLPHGLTGSLKVDAESVKVVKPFIFAMPESLADIELPPDNKTGVVNTAINQPIQHMADLGEIIKLAAKLFKSNTPKFEAETPKYNSITEAYSVAYLARVLEFNKKDVKPFVTFVEANDFDFLLLNEAYEIQFIDYILKQKSLYLAKQNGKD